MYFWSGMSNNYLKVVTDTYYWMKNIVTVFIIVLCFCFFSNDAHAQFFSPPVFNHEAAAKAGYGDGLCIRGLSNLVDKKYSEAYKYLYQAYDECDNAKAAAYLGIMFEHGLGVSVNRDTAKSLYTWSQKKGDSFGAGNLARIINMDSTIQPLNVLTKCSKL